MICAPFCSGSTGVFREQLLVIVDSACYAVCAIAAVALTPKTDDTRSAVGCTAIYFAVCITSSWYRHVRHACAACNHNEKPSGTARIPPVNLTNAAAVKPLTFMHVAPVIVMWVGVFWLYASRDAPAMNPCVVAVLLVASELHVWMSRGHGDHSGGKVLRPSITAFCHTMRWCVIMREDRMMDSLCVCSFSLTRLITACSGPICVDDTSRCFDERHAAGCGVESASCVYCVYVLRNWL